MTIMQTQTSKMSIKDHSSQILDHLKNLLFEEFRSDFKIKTMRNRSATFNAHKAVLSAFFPNLDNFYPNMIQLDAEPNAIKAFLSLVYLGQTDLPPGVTEADLRGVEGQILGFNQDSKISFETLGRSTEDLIFDIKYEPEDVKDYSIAEGEIEILDLDSLAGKKESKPKPDDLMDLDDMFKGNKKAKKRKIEEEPVDIMDMIGSRYSDIKISRSKLAEVDKKVESKSSKKIKKPEKVKSKPKVIENEMYRQIKNPNKTKREVKENEIELTEDVQNVDLLILEDEPLEDEIETNKEQKLDEDWEPSKEKTMNKESSSNEKRKKWRGRNRVKSIAGDYRSKMLLERFEELIPMEEVNIPMREEDIRGKMDEILNLNFKLHQRLGRINICDVRISFCILCVEKKKLIFCSRNRFMDHFRLFHPYADVDEFWPMKRKHRGKTNFVRFELEAKSEAVMSEMKGKGLLPFGCDDCDLSFARADIKAAHMAYRHEFKDEEMQFCDECPYRTTDRDEIRDHEENEHSDLTVPCEECGMLLTGPEKLIQHVNKEHLRQEKAGKVPPCDLCGFTGKSITSVASHREAVHFSKRYTDSFKCPYCQVKFSSMQPLHKHIDNKWCKMLDKVDIETPKRSLWTSSSS